MIEDGTGKGENRPPPILPATNPVPSGTKGVKWFDIICSAITPWISFVIFLVLMVYVIPKFEQIFMDMLGKDAELPELTQMVLAMSHAVEKNFILIVLFLICIGSAWTIICILPGLVGQRNEGPLIIIRKIAEVVFIVFLAVIVGSIVIAMFLPLIDLMDKLGSE